MSAAASTPGRVVLVVDDEPHIARLVGALLGASARVLSVASGDAAIAQLDALECDVVLCDLVLGDEDGLALVRRLRRRDADLPVIMLTGQPSVESAIAAIREGAFDYLRKTASGPELRAAVERAAAHGALSREVRRLRREVDRAAGGLELVGQSLAMRQLLALVERVAPADGTSVLILGESGTGKELLARAIHRLSPRKDAPFVAFDCSALAPSLLESELFGHERGAFTGAQRARRGLFREAHGGTLLLDEIGDIAPEVQNKLLRVLQEREIKPVGGDAFVKVDVRVLAATNKDLKALVARGQFREDLYYRLAVMPLLVPPLRDRRDDLPLLATSILARRRARGAATPLGLAPDALGRLSTYAWPGNVRELENVLARAALLCDGDEIRAEHLPSLGPDGHAAGAPAVPEVATAGKTLKQVVAEATSAIERQALRDALLREDGSPTRAAKLLGISRATFYNKLKEHGITP